MTDTSDLFGALRSQTGSTANYWLFSGEQFDRAAGDAGYYFLRACYYDPALGRFIGRDPLQFDQRYVYASDNPLLFIDRRVCATSGEVIPGTSASTK